MKVSQAAAAAASSVDLPLSAAAWSLSLWDSPPIYSEGLCGVLAALSAHRPSKSVFKCFRSVRPRLCGKEHGRLPSASFAAVLLVWLGSQWFENTVDQGFNMRSIQWTSSVESPLLRKMAGKSGYWTVSTRLADVFHGNGGETWSRLKLSPLRRYVSEFLSSKKCVWGKR